MGNWSNILYFLSDFKWPIALFFCGLMLCVYGMNSKIQKDAGMYYKRKWIECVCKDEKNETICRDLKWVSGR